jgi:choloylglycine hydrolase
MCTSLTLKTKDGYNIHGRTMDFGMTFNQSVHIIPRNLTWVNILDKKENKTKYALVGMAVVTDNHPVLADGVNETGLTCASLYFKGFTKYEKKTVENKENIAPYDFVLWALSQFRNLDEVKEALKNIEIVDKTLSFLNVSPPLHWILSDRSGKSIVIEKTKNGIEVFDNPVGVMTNSPNFEWHLNNLRQYIGITPKQFDSSEIGSLSLSAFGQGSGTFGLPGDFTSPSRFVRATYLKNNISQINNEIEGVTGVFHILSNCAVPKGSVLMIEGNVHNTIYTSAMCSESGTYYYNTYENHQISAVNLFNEDLDATSIKAFPTTTTQAINNMN